MLEVLEESVYADVGVVPDKPAVGQGYSLEGAKQLILQPGKLCKAEDRVEEHTELLHKYMLEDVVTVFRYGKGRVLVIQSFKKNWKKKTYKDCE